MLAHERLIEAIEYMKEDGGSWIEAFDSKTQIRTILKEALRYIPDEYEVIQLAELMGYEYPQNQFQVVSVYRSILRQLKTELDD